MKTLGAVLITGVCLLVLGQVAVLAKETEDFSATGEKLVRDLWADFAKTDMKAIEARMAGGFQAVHEFGASNRTEELAILKELKLSDYTLTDFKVTHEGDVLIVTYKITVAETIKGKRLAKEPALRLSVFRKADGVWQWIAHANLRPMEERK